MCSHLAELPEMGFCVDCFDVWQSCSSRFACILIWGWPWLKRSTWCRSLTVAFWVIGSLILIQVEFDLSLFLLWGLGLDPIQRLGWFWLVPALRALSWICFEILYPLGKLQNKWLDFMGLSDCFYSLGLFSRVYKNIQYLGLTFSSLFCYFACTMKWRYVLPQ